LLEIEKLIKRPVPRGTLDVPRDLVVRSHTRSHETDRRNVRAGGRSDGGARTRYEPPREPVDEFFYKPYEPAVSVATTEAQSNQLHQAAAPARKRAVLLGGLAGKRT